MFSWLIAAAHAVGRRCLHRHPARFQRSGTRRAEFGGVGPGVASYAVGLAAMLLLALALRDPLPATAMAARLPWWAWSGGLFGAIYIGLAIFLVPQLGANTFVVLLVAGQMMTSIVIDHFGCSALLNARSICRDCLASRS